MKIHQLTPEKALVSLNSSADGLTLYEAQRRLVEFGRNRVEEIRGEPLWLAFAKEFTHFFALILWLAAGLAFFAGQQASGKGMSTLGWAILGVILINGLFSFWQEYRAKQAIVALQKLLPQQIKVMRDGHLDLVAAATLVLGDVVLLQEGDIVPADCRLLEATSLRVNTATVTGESLLKSRAPALKAADIGIAIGVSGTDAAKASADMILLDDNFASIVAAIEEGRAVFDNIRKFLAYILTSNIPELVPYLAFVLFKIPLPLTVIQILAIDLGTDMLPALGLGTEPPDPDIMRRSPRPRRERLLNWGLVLRAYCFLGIMEAAIAMSAFLRAESWRLGIWADTAAWQHTLPAGHDGYAISHHRITSS